MNALFHHNMQQQIAANEAARIQAQQTAEKSKQTKDSPAYIYLHFIFSNGGASSQQLQARRPAGASKFSVYKALSNHIQLGHIQYTKLNQYGGIYEPVEGVTAAVLGIDLGCSDD